MTRPFVLLLSLLVCSTALAAEKPLADEEHFVRQIVAALIEKQPTPGFAVADKVVALDNGEMLSREDFQKAWPEFCKTAFREKVWADVYFAKMDLKMEPVTDNKRLMSNRRLLAAYNPQKGERVLRRRSCQERREATHRLSQGIHLRHPKGRRQVDADWHWRITT